MKEILDTQDLINRIRSVHNDNYDLSEVVYKDKATPIKITCNKCNEQLEVLPFTLLKGVGCKCQKKSSLSNKEFIARAIAVNGSENYDYTDTRFTQYHNKVMVRCLDCGKKVRVKAQIHLAGCRCLYCSLSSGAKAIWDFLERNNIEFETEKTFPNLVYTHHLKYDFYIPSYNTLIEYNGELHYKYSPRFHKTQEKFKEVQLKDKMKADFAKSHGIELVTITYEQQKNIDNILQKELNLPDSSAQPEVPPSPIDESYLSVDLESGIRRVHDGLDTLNSVALSCPHDLKIDCLRDLLAIEDLVEKLGKKIRKYCEATL